MECCRDSTVVHIGSSLSFFKKWKMARHPSYLPQQWLPNRYTNKEGTKKLMEKTAICNGKSCAPDVWHQRRQHLWWLLANNIDRQSKDSNPYGTPDIIQFSIDISSVLLALLFSAVATGPVFFLFRTTRRQREKERDRQLLSKTFTAF